MPSKFTHLHVHSQYSLLDGLPKIPDLLDYVKELGMDSVALTDHGVLYGAVSFYKEAVKRGIKPIIGAELYVANNSMTDKRPNIDHKRYHLILLVKNEQGYKNLVKLITCSHLEGFYYKPRIDEKLLAQYAEGLIGMSACLQGRIPKLILAKKLKEAEEKALKYQEIFGKGNFYLELQHHKSIKEQEALNDGLIALSKKTGIPLVATQDLHYLRPEDAEAQDVLMLINTGADPNDPERLTMKQDDFSMTPPEEMKKIFAKTPEAISNTQKIVDLCNFKLELGKTKLPGFDVPGNKTADEYLRELVFEKLKNRYPDPDKKVEERIEYELSVITKTGFASYFLIVQDFVNWAKQNRIIVGPGRGSAPGSIVSYILGITAVDPLKYDLLFERFLNPERISFPDIDLDFTDRRRDEVINYVSEKYGRDKVAQIITFGTMAARAAIRDVGRALQYEYSYCDKLAKMIPFGFTLKDTLKKIKEFKDFYEEDIKAKRLVDLAMKLEGVARHASTHACGVVIGDQPLDNIVPLQHPTQNDQNIVTQYDMKAIEDLGLLKMDFLGLKNLTVIEDTLSRIYVIHNKSIDIEKIPLDDKKVFKNLRDGRTAGVFQLEGSGMTRYLKELKPTEFEDIVAMITLFRPGPMEFIPSYIKRKHGKEKIEYLHPKLEPILKKTYGICVTGDTRIQLANPGSVLSINEAVNSPDSLTVQAFDGQSFVKDKIITKFDNGIKNVYKIKLRTGKQIKATADHQFLTPFGWKKVKELSFGDFLATPRKLFSGVNNFNENKLKILAYLIADGSLTSGSSSYFVNKDKILLQDFKKRAESGFDNLKITFTKHFRGVKRANPSRLYRNDVFYHEANSLLKWLRELGLKSKDAGKNSAEKFVPSFVFKLNEKLMSSFLATLWDCDGGIAAKMAYLTTISEKLAYDIQTLVLKLGINCYIYQQSKYKNRKGQITPVYRVVIYNLAAFSKKIGQRMLSSKKKLLKNIKIDADYKDFVPRQIFLDILKKYLNDHNISQRSFSLQHGINRSCLWGKIGKNRNRLNCKIAEKIAKVVNNDKLNEILNKNIRWEDIVLIDSAGKEQVYDVEIKNAHNFVANNIVSHNCIYQEQLLQIARDLAGFSYGQADILRKAIGKKIKSLLDEQKDKLIQGMRDNEVSDRVAKEIWEWILPFAQYGFNRSHSCCYALIAYQTAWLKTNYPVEFMASLLTSERHDIEKIAFLIEECKRMKIEVLPPDINESLTNFTVVPGQQEIRFGLSAIKNVGNNIVKAITQERKEGGSFKNLGNFLSRINSKDLNKKSLESMTRAGVFDSIIERNQILSNIEDILEFNREHQKKKDSGQRNLFEGKINLGSDIRLVSAVPASKKEKLEWEKELLGLFITSHPLDSFKAIFDKKASPLERITRQVEGKKIRVAGILSNLKKIITKNGKPMLFVKLEDLTDKIEVVVFPSILERNPLCFRENKIVFITGRVSYKDNSPKIICDDVQEIIETD
ncbi:DNA polymerase III subunit alpha [Candidatus Parcubacteria bacterium]|nr:DNA polymerase III subunit alpha [Candidatus Parcubacteria bacterium]